MTAFDDSAKLAELRRELRLRERLYPQWIEAGRMTRPVADRQTGIIREIIRDYEQRESNRRQHGDLFS